MQGFAERVDKVPRHEAVADGEELVALDAKGEATSPVRRISPEKGRVASFDLVRTGGPSDAPWWLRLGSLVPFAVLLGGLLLIDNHYLRTQIDAAAEVDAAILVDDLPPEAYRDQGFVEYLKSSRP